jgi:hypothetical protein
MDNVQEVRYDKPSLMPAYASMNRRSRRLDRVLELFEGGAMKSTQTEAWIITAILVTAGALDAERTGPARHVRALHEGRPGAGNWLMYSGSYSGGGSAS